MSSFTIRFEGSISLQEPDATGARSVLIQNLRIYLPEDIERGIVPPNSTAPHIPSESSQPSYKQEDPVEIQEKQEEKLPIILTPYSVVTDDEDDDNQPNFQWSWSHTTPLSSSSSTEVPNAPIKSKKSVKKEIDPFNFSATPPSSSSSTKVPNAPIKSKLPSTYSSNWIEKTRHNILQAQHSKQSSSVSSSVKPSSPSSSSDEKCDLEQLFNTHLKQFKMIPESMCENNPQKKQKHFYHFMFWHNFQHNGQRCLDTCKCIINYIYNVIPDYQLNHEEYHHRDRCKTLQKIMESRQLHFNPLCCYYSDYLSFLELNKHQNVRHKLNRYQLMNKYINDVVANQ